MFEFRTLKDTSVSLLIKCFNEAFSDYSLPVNLSEEQFCAFLKADRVDLALSFGAFFKGEPIGFMLNSSGIYHNEKIVFDAGYGYHSSVQRTRSVFAIACGGGGRDSKKRYQKVLP